MWCFALKEDASTLLKHSMAEVRTPIVLICICACIAMPLNDDHAAHPLHVMPAKLAPTIRLHRPEHTSDASTHHLTFTSHGAWSCFLFSSTLHSSPLPTNPISQELRTLTTLQRYTLPSSIVGYVCAVTSRRSASCHEPAQYYSAPLSLHADGLGYSLVCSRRRVEPAS